jgi:hypothetical protein
MATTQADPVIQARWVAAYREGGITGHGLRQTEHMLENKLADAREWSTTARVRHFEVLVTSLQAAISEVGA